MSVFKVCFVLAGLANIYSKILNQSSNKDKCIKNELKNTENFKLYSDSENSTTVDNSSIESAKKSKNLIYIFYLVIE